MAESDKKKNALAGVRKPLRVIEERRSTRNGFVVER
jgi:hypothetical protein